MFGVRMTNEIITFQHIKANRTAKIFSRMCPDAMQMHWRHWIEKFVAYRATSIVWNWIAHCWREGNKNRVPKCLTSKCYDRVLSNSLDWQAQILEATTIATDSIALRDLVRASDACVYVHLCDERYTIRCRGWINRIPYTNTNEAKRLNDNFETNIVIVLNRKAIGVNENRNWNRKTCTFYLYISDFAIRCIIKYVLILLFIRLCVFELSWYCECAAKLTHYWAME